MRGGEQQQEPEGGHKAEAGGSKPQGSLPLVQVQVGPHEATAGSPSAVAAAGGAGGGEAAAPVSYAKLFACVPAARGGSGRVGEMAGDGL